MGTSDIQTEIFAREQEIVMGLKRISEGTDN